MEEIDIIELLKRVKEGKAPKHIMFKNHRYTYNNRGLISMYFRYENEHIIYWFEDSKAIFPDTKIKILDKPIIEELDDYNNVDIFDLAIKVNEIIRYLNKEEK